MHDSIRISNTAGALGAEITGVDLSRDLDAATLGAIRAAWDAHLVLVFRGQVLSDPQLIRFSRCFGELDPPGPNPYGGPFHQAHPELNVSEHWWWGISPEGIGTLGMLINFVVTVAVSKLSKAPPQSVQDQVEAIRYPRKEDAQDFTI